MPRVATILAVTLLLLSVAGSAGVAVAQSGGETVTVTVAVRDTAGNPVGDADLDVTWDGGSTTVTTAGNGKAFVDVPAGADATVRVTHERYVRNEPFVVTDASEREVEIRVYRKSSIRLEVSDANGSVADASVLIERGGLDVKTGTTNRNGVFESGVIQRGDYTITITKPGYVTRRKSLTADGDVTNRIALRRGAVDVTVRVTDPRRNGSPVDAVTVELDGIETATTDTDGAVTVEAPVNTATTLHVSKDGYRTVTRDLRIDEEATNVSVDLSRTRSIALESTNQRVVAGERAAIRATDAYGDPVTDATVTLDGEPVGTTDADGRAAVQVTDPGTHTLRVTASGVRSNAVQVEAIAVDGEATATPTETEDPATATATPTATPTGTSVESPGFGVVAAVVALLGVGVGLRRRRRRR